MKRKNFPRRKEERARKAQLSISQWRKLTPQEQLSSLDRRLGVGVGAVKQRKRLNEQIS